MLKKFNITSQCNAIFLFLLLISKPPHHTTPYISPRSLRGQCILLYPCDCPPYSPISSHSFFISLSCISFPCPHSQHSLPPSLSLSVSLPPTLLSPPPLSPPNLYLTFFLKHTLKPILPHLLFLSFFLYQTRATKK